MCLVPPVDISCKKKKTAVNPLKKQKGKVLSTAIKITIENIFIFLPA